MKKLLALFGLSLASFPPLPALAENYTVVNTGDSGAGSLRAAMTSANNDPGPHRIMFNIPITGVQTITLLSPLPLITNKTAIDATTQPGYFSAPSLAGKPMIELDGLNLAGVANGFHITSTATGSSIRGFSIGNFPNVGIQVEAVSCTLAANHIGVDASGTVARPNVYGINLLGSTHLIGGSDARRRNVVSGNTAEGIRCVQCGSWIRGNFIGTNASGTAAIPNGGTGIRLDDAEACEIGGLGDQEGNLISGNVLHGVHLFNGSPVTQANVAYSNLIGTNVYGTEVIANGQNGINLQTQKVIIGDPEGPNTISGNGGNGVYIEGPFAGQVEVSDNFIGTTSDGTRPLGNSNEGIWVSASDANTIRRNTIGASGTDGIRIDGGAVNNIIFGNFIGTNAGGLTNLANTGAGVWINGNGNWTVGGNIIAYNQFGGVMVQAGLYNLIRESSIYRNGWSNVDLINGFVMPVTPNDAGDVDTGPNGFLNFPVINSVTYIAGALRILGVIHTKPNTMVSLDFFSSPNCHPTGYGGGESHVGNVGLTTNASGDGTFDVMFPGQLVAGLVFTANASTDEGTSEFSACYTMSATVDADAPRKDLGFSLGAARPPPARGPLRIPFSLAHSSKVSLRVFDVAGRAVATLIDGELPAGPHEATWQASQVRAGVYWYRLTASSTDGPADAFQTAKRAVVID